MSRAIPVASGSADAQAFTGAATLVGATLLVGATATTVYLRDGTTAAGAIVAALKAPANSTVHVQVPACDVATGLFVDRDGTNSTELVLYVL
jgi:hypothetical protein